MRTIKLTENDCTFVHYVLRMYAQQTPGLDQEDKEEIREVAARFRYGMDRLKQLHGLNELLNR